MQKKKNKKNPPLNTKCIALFLEVNKTNCTIEYKEPLKYWYMIITMRVKLLVVRNYKQRTSYKRRKFYNIINMKQVFLVILNI